MKWAVFGLVYVLLVILPVWIINLVKLGLFDRILFTVGGAVAVYFILKMKGYD